MLVYFLEYTSNYEEKFRNILYTLMVRTCKALKVVCVNTTCYTHRPLRRHPALEQQFGYLFIFATVTVNEFSVLKA